MNKQTCKRLNSDVISAFKSPFSRGCTTSLITCVGLLCCPVLSNFPLHAPSAQSLFPFSLSLYSIPLLRLPSSPLHEMCPVSLYLRTESCGEFLLPACAKGVRDPPLVRCTNPSTATLLTSRPHQAQSLLYTPLTTPPSQMEN